MKKSLIVVLVLLFVSLSGFDPGPRKGPYEFTQEADQIVSIEILEMEEQFYRYNTPTRVAYTLEEKDFLPLVEAFEAADGYVFYLDEPDYLIHRAVRIRYRDGGTEVLFPAGCCYIPAGGKRDYKSYDFGLETFEDILAPFYTPGEAGYGGTA